MNPLFWPFVNTLVRFLLKPIAPFLNPDLHPRVNGTIRVKMQKPKSLRLRVNPTSYLGKVLFFRGIEGYEWPSIRVFIEVAKQSTNFFDVGANIGYYSCLAALHNPSLNIYSFEPLAGAKKYLCENIELNGFSNIQVIPKALSNQQGSTSFYVAHDSTFAHLQDHLTTTGGFNQSLSSRTPLTQEFQVETETADQIWEDCVGSGEQLDLMKLDTEASEHLVLEGAAVILERDKPLIFCEVLPDMVGEEIERIIQSHNYLMYSVSEAGLKLTDSIVDQRTSSNDYVFVHPQRLNQIRAYLA